MGAPFSSGSGIGKAYIYARSGASWFKEAELLSNVPSTVAWFGWSASISKDGTKAAVGEYDGDPPTATNAGKAYIFTRSGSVWSYGTSVYASDGTTNDNFGKSVAIDETGSRVAVGDPSKNSNFGKVYIYT